MTLKVELHTHTADDPIDRIPHTAPELIDRASALGYGALAITLHRRQLDISLLKEYAEQRGIVLISGIEQSIEGRHVLLINFSQDAEKVRTFDDLRSLKRREAGLVVAPHPFFPAPNCLFGCLDRYADLFDAVECNAMFTASLNFNRRAERWAALHNKPLVGNGDVHRLRQLGTTYSLVDAERSADAVCAAIKEGRVQVVSKPLEWRDAVGIIGAMFVSDFVSHVRSRLQMASLLRSHRSSPRPAAHRTGAQALHGADARDSAAAPRDRRTR
jgi:predicted metal-dependent phosphoesterase TrpH